MLVERLKIIAQKAEALKLENEELKEKLFSMETKLTELVTALEKEKNKNKIAENNLKITRFANVLSNDDLNDKEEIQAKLDYFIDHIDRCINLLKD